jgi:hypothetical protein
MSQNKKYLCLDGEIWKDIEKYKGIYMISNFGRVKSLKRKWKLKDFIMSAYLDKRGYFNINLFIKHQIKHFYVHRLVAQAFLPLNTENKRTINHIDGNKINNIPSNLEWATDQENITHAVQNGFINTRGENSKMSKLKTDDILKIRDLFNKTKNYKMISKQFNIHARTVYKIINKERWKHI